MKNDRLSLSFRSADDAAPTARFTCGWPHHYAALDSLPDRKMGGVHDDSPANLYAAHRPG